MYIDEPQLASRTLYITSGATADHRGVTLPGSAAVAKRMMNRFYLRRAEQLMAVSRAVRAEVQLDFYARTTFDWTGHATRYNRPQGWHREALDARLRNMFFRTFFDNVRHLKFTWSEDVALIQRVVDLPDLESLALDIVDSELYLQQVTATPSGRPLKRCRDPNLWLTRGASDLLKLRGLKSFSLELNFKREEDVARWEAANWFIEFRDALMALARSPKIVPPPVVVYRYREI